ncbi:unnamed protein product [Cylindrotheca closterium]|uniref:Casein kinase II subunit beta n=1 Tax=Cylindrotheca closterium TaxID=2856 RepID=A0AAD2FZP7_9STRA|nr:unnamed protein product [Cylindrotheca closterium]
MAVKFQRSLLFLALFNASWSSFAKGFRRSQRNVFPYHTEESSDTGNVFQSEASEKSSDEEQVLAAIARAEDSGNDISGCYSRTYHQSFDLSDDNAFSSLMDQGVDKPLSIRANKRKRELGITDAVESKSSSLTKAPLSKTSLLLGAQMKQQPIGTNRSSSSGPHSERWQPRTSQSTSIRIGNNVKKQSAIPTQQLKGSISDAAKSQKSSSTTTPWIRRYLISRPRDVPKDFIADGFNVARLGPIVERIGFQVAGDDAVAIAKELMQVSTRSYPIYRLALQLILNETDDNSVVQHSIVPPQVLHVAAEALYLMVHSRFCQSARGLDSLKRIVRVAMFGRCPRASCDGAPLLPYGASNDFQKNHLDQHCPVQTHHSIRRQSHIQTSGVLRNSFCQRFCPKCGEVWIWWDSKTDGCAFGPSLCHLFLLTHGADIYPVGKLSSKDAADSSRAPFCVMGFRIHPATTWGGGNLKNG